MTETSVRKKTERRQKSHFTKIQMQKYKKLKMTEKTTAKRAKIILNLDSDPGNQNLNHSEKNVTKIHL